MKNLIPVKATELQLNAKLNHIVYQTDVTSGPGILLMADKSGTKDMYITNAIHEDGPVVLTLKPTSFPAKKYEVGDLIAYLLVLDGEK